MYNRRADKLKASPAEMLASTSPGQFDEGSFSEQKKPYGSSRLTLWRPQASGDDAADPGYAAVRGTE
jgi:hypothetical protein